MLGNAVKWFKQYSPMMLTFLVAAAGVAFIAYPALAQGGQICTYDEAFKINYPDAGSGLVSILVNNITLIINNLAFNMYSAILNNPSFQLSVRAMLTIALIIFGILFTFGMIQVTMMDFLIRIVKFSIIGALLTPYSWDFFYNFVGRFFNDGTNWLIALMSQIAVGEVAGINPNYPFAVIDNAIAHLTSAKMFASLVATFFTGPYGLVIGLMLLFGLGTFVSALLQAMWVYLVALVIRAFLFALAPIFMSFLLFQRTNHLFNGWLNALVSASLQPIFLFTFFAFFMKLVEAAIVNILRVPACITPVANAWQGSPFSIDMWRFMVPDPNNAGNFVQFNGAWTFQGPDMANALGVFPINIMDVLIFLLLVQLAFRFNGIVVNIAKDIAGVSLSLNVGGAASEFMSTAATGGRANLLRNAARGGGGLAGAKNQGDFVAQMQEFLRRR